MGNKIGISVTAAIHHGSTALCFAIKSTLQRYLPDIPIAVHFEPHMNDRDLELYEKEMEEQLKMGVLKINSLGLGIPNTVKIDGIEISRNLISPEEKSWITHPQALPCFNKTVYAIVEDSSDPNEEPFMAKLVLTDLGQESNPRVAWYLSDVDHETQEALLQQRYNVVVWRYV